MTYKSLYRTYRPHSFDTVVGQKHIVQTLQNAIKSEKLSHAYLFCGPRGTGKTTVAKLLAKSINCLNHSEAPCTRCEHCISIQNGTHPDVIEIDAASNNGVDEIRELIEKVKYAPILAQIKVYIIDEVHMLSQGAFNALLKTLEEPPSHVIFILATTEPHKVLPTIISRCQRYDFVRVNQRDIQARIEEVLKQEKIKYEPEAIRLISQLADGGVRDALSILEQVIAYSGDKLTTQHVNDIYGIATTQEKIKLLDAIIDEDVSKLMFEIESISKKNIDIRRLTNDLMEILKEAVVYAYTSEAHLLLRLNAKEADSLNRVPALLILSMIEDLMDTAEKYRSASNINAYFEIGLLKLLSRIANPKKVLDEKNETYNRETRPVGQSNQKHEDSIVPIRVEEKDKAPLVKAETEPKLIHEDVIIKEEPKIEEEVLLSEESASIVLDDQFLLSLLVSADKNHRQSINQSWPLIQEYRNHPDFARLAHMLNKTETFASNQEFIIVHSSDDYTVGEMNQIDLAASWTLFMEDLFKQSLRFYAITNTKSAELLKSYRELNEKNALPEPIKIETVKKKAAKKKESSAEIEVLNLFGEENVEII